MGAAYYVRAMNDVSTDHGFLAASAGIDNTKVEPVMKAILGEFNRIKNERVSEKELQMVKDSIVGSLYLGLETSDEVASYFGGQEVLKKAMISPDDYAAKIQSVTADDVQRVAKIAFVESHLNSAIIGPIKDGKFIADLLKL